jgi:hypothetical protein
MSMRAFLAPILNDDRLTRGLDDAEARMLVEWLIAQAEGLSARDPSANLKVARRVKRARGIARFVALWCHERSAGAALQLAATERFGWPLPVREMDACDLMHDILAWEQEALPS